MDRSQIKTGRIDSNQERIDELEFFIEGLGRFLFGEQGEDFRLLREYVPQTRNLSALYDQHKQLRQQERDPAEDLGFLYSELESHVRLATKSRTPPARESVAIFHYGRYLEFLDRPERLLEFIPMDHRFEVASKLAEGAMRAAPVLARVNAYAWLCVIGLPDLEQELTSEEPARFTLSEDATAALAGFDRLVAACRPVPGSGMRTFMKVAWQKLLEEYRSQLARLAATTRPLGQ